jgi:hypothetical protein
MRWIILLFVISPCAHKTHQSYAYAYASDFYGEHLTLNVDSTFSWTTYSCAMDCSIADTYSINGNRLKLSTEVNKRKAIAHHPTVAEQDSCRLSFHLLFEDESNEPAVFSVVFVVHNGDSMPIKGAVTDMNGNCEFRIHKQYFPLTINFRYVGYHTEKLKIEQPAHLQDTVYLERWSCGISADGFPEQYRIRKLNRRKLLLEELNFPTTDSIHADSTRRRSIHLKRVHKKQQ